MAEYKSVRGPTVYVQDTREIEVYNPLKAKIKLLEKHEQIFLKQQQQLEENNELLYNACVERDTENERIKEMYEQEHNITNEQLNELHLLKITLKCSKKWESVKTSAYQTEKKK
eukprot:302869_1